MRSSVPFGSTLGKIYLPTTILVCASDGGLDSVVTDRPEVQNGFPLYTERLAFTLQGRPAGAVRPFMRNPTSCHPATTTVDATAYDPATTVSRTSRLHADCLRRAAVPAARRRPVGARGLTARRARRAHPPVAGTGHAPPLRVSWCAADSKICSHVHLPA